MEIREIEEENRPRSVLDVSQGGGADRSEQSMLIPRENVTSGLLVRVNHEAIDLACYVRQEVLPRALEWYRNQRT